MTPEQLRKQRDRLREMMQRCRDEALDDPTPTPPKRRYTVRATIRSIRRGKPTPFMEDAS